MNRKRVIGWLGSLPSLRLAALFAAMMLVPVVALVYVSVRLPGDALKSEVENRIESTALASAAYLRAELDGLAQLVDSYANRPKLREALERPELRTAGREIVDASLSELRRRPGVATAFVVDPAGRLMDIEPETPSIVGDDLSYRDWYRGAMATGQAYVSEAYRSKSARRPHVVAAAAPIRAPGSGKVLGIIVAAYGLDTVQGFTNRIAAAQSVELTVVDRAGTLVAAPGAGAGRLESRTSDPRVTAALDGRSGITTFGQQLSAHAPVPELGWGVIASVPTSVAHAPVAALLSVVVPISGFLVLAVACTLALLTLTLQERGRYERALSEREAHTSAVIEAAKDAFVAMDAHGCITGWNARAEASFGWSRDEAVGRRLSETIVPEPLREAHQRGLAAFLATGEGPILNRRVEIEALHRDGHTFPVELAVWPVRINDEWSFNALIQDIRERKEAETTRSHLAAIVDGSDDAILGKTLDGTIISWNAGAERLYGYSAEEAIGRSVAMLVPPDRPDEVAEILRRIRQGNTIQHLDTVRMRKDGHQIPVSLTISPIEDGHGNIVGASTIARDMSERDRVQRELEVARDQALEAARVKSEFLANMSHEIRTPLNGVIGMTSLLLDTGLSSEQREYTETIRSSGETLLAVINDILDFSKIESGQLNLEVVDFSVREAVEEVAEILGELAHRKGLELATLVERDVPAVVLGDPSRLRQVLFNLIGNAIKFTGEGEVVVRVTFVEEAEDAVVARFEVSDTGIGISPEARSRLFQSFSQADASTTRRFGGTGLGLVISRQLVELMGGSIGVHSEEDKGSTFFFTVTFGKSSQQSLLPYQRLAAWDLRVLVVDDNAANRTIMEQTLGQWGIEVSSAADADEALAMLRRAADASKPYGACILDYHMPGMDGIALAGAIRADPALADTPLALATSSGDRAQAREAAAVGIEAYLTKPVRQSSLYDALATVLGLERRHAPQRIAATHDRGDDRASGDVLLVEDNRVNQRVAVRMLEKLGYRVEVAANGQEAVEAVSANRYSVVLMDCQMPVMDGYEATRRIRSLGEPTAGIPIIAMTAAAMEADRRRAADAGMDDYISKPVKREDLAAILDRWLRAPARPVTDEGEATHDQSLDGDHEPVLDPEMLAQLRELDAGQHDDSPSFVEDFLSSSTATLEKLRAAVAAADTGEIRFHAHTLKGSTATLGARRARARCAEMESIAADWDPERAAQTLARIESELDRVAIELGLPDLRPAPKRPR